jgi:hypothetical protein
MNIEMNTGAIIGLAVNTSMLRCGYDQDARPADLEDQDAWDSVIELTLTYLKWVGVERNTIEIDKYVVAECFWGMVDDELDNELSELD